MKESQLHKIANCDRADRIGDVIFVHGLGGDAFGTWHPQGKKDDDQSWLYWLGQDAPDVGIWSIDYEVEPSAWKGNAMPLTDRQQFSLWKIQLNPPSAIENSCNKMGLKAYTFVPSSSKNFKSQIKMTRPVLITLLKPPNLR